MQLATISVDQLTAAEMPIQCVDVLNGHTIKWGSEEAVAMEEQRVLAELEAKTKQLLQLERTNPLPDDMTSLTEKVSAVNDHIEQTQRSVLGALSDALTLQERFQSLETVIERCDHVIPLLDALLTLSDPAQIGRIDAISGQNLHSVVDIIADTRQATLRLKGCTHDGFTEEMAATLESRRAAVRDHVVDTIDAHFKESPELTPAVTMAIRHLARLDYPDLTMKYIRFIVDSEVDSELPEGATDEALVTVLGERLRDLMKVYRLVLGPLSMAITDRDTQLEYIHDKARTLTGSVWDRLRRRDPAPRSGLTLQGLKALDTRQNVSVGLIRTISGFTEARAALIGHLDPHGMHPRVVLEEGTVSAQVETDLLHARVAYMKDVDKILQSRGVFNIAIDVVHFIATSIKRAQVYSLGKPGTLIPITTSASDEVRWVMDFIGREATTDPLRAVLINSLASMELGLGAVVTGVRAHYGKDGGEGLASAVEPLEDVLVGVTGALYRRLDLMGRAAIDKAVLPLIDDLVAKCVAERPDAASAVSGLTSAFTPLDPDAGGALKRETFAAMMGRAVSSDRGDGSVASLIRSRVFPVSGRVQYSRHGALRLFGGIKDVAAQWTTMARRACATEFAPLIDDLLILTVENEAQLLQMVDSARPAADRRYELVRMYRNDLQLAR